MRTSTAKRTGGVWEFLKTILIAVLIAIGIRTFLYEPFNIPSASMVPTLLVGDYLFVSKMSYGFSRHSLPFSMPLIPNRVLFDEPKRGDVLVFKKPTNTDIDFIKRLIGLPGDKIQMRGGILYINGKPLDRQRIEDYLVVGSSVRRKSVSQFIETLPNGRKYLILEQRHNIGSADNTRIFQVPPDHYFMMGDNRDNSVDSRDPSIGFVPKVNLVGRAEILFWAWDSRWAWWEFWNWPRAIRFSRLLALIK